MFNPSLVPLLMPSRKGFTILTLSNLPLASRLNIAWNLTSIARYVYIQYTIHSLSIHKMDYIQLSQSGNFKMINKAPPVIISCADFHLQERAMRRMIYKRIDANYQELEQPKP